MPGTVEKIVRFCALRAWPTIFVWVALLGLAGYLISGHLSDALTSAQKFTNDQESQRAGELMEKHFPDQSGGSELVIVESSRFSVDSNEFKAFVTKLATDISQNDSVERVVSQPPLPNLVSRDRQAMLVTVEMRGELADQEERVPALIDLIGQAETTDFTTHIIGPASIGRSFSAVSEQDLQTGELYGLPVTLIILVIVFGAVVAALLPLMLAIIAIVAAVGVTAVVGSSIHEISFFVVNMITMMGLAVGVDYSLFMVSRFREERASGLDKTVAISKAGATAGRAVLFSGLTVVLALAGLLLIPMNIFQGLAAGAIFVVVFAIVAALTLLPAVLNLVGDRINYLRIGPRRTANTNQTGGFWDALTRRIMRWPIASLLLAAGILLLAAMPALDLRIGASGIGSMPPKLEVRQAYEVLRDKFDLGLLSPAMLVIETDPTQPAITEAVKNFQAELAANAEFGPSQPLVSPDGQAVAVLFSIKAENTSDQALSAVGHLRTEVVPKVFGPSGVKVSIGGEAANNLDFITMTRDYAFPIFSFVLGLSFILLMLVFRSIVVPLKAIMMNLLSVAAAYGLLVLVFQKGVGAAALGFQQVDKIEAWLPLFLFCVLFGLSMDYHVFLLSRIRERFTKTGDNTEAVAFGVRSTASLITGAALIMVAVFAGFAMGDLVMFQQMGFGLAVAILLDATIVRSFLVPASMRLLGERNWYLPKWLRWLPNIAVE